MAMMQPVEFRTLEQGFRTETNYLDVPPNVTLDEANFDIDPRGVRRRRFGLQYETGHPIFDMGLPYSLSDTPMVTSYLWENVAGIATLTFLAVQFNNRLLVFNTNSDQISAEPLTSNLGLTISDDAQLRAPFDYAVVDGDLIITNGEQTISIVSVQGLTDPSDLEGISFAVEKERLLIRDTFGISVDYQLPTESNKIVSLQDPRYRGVRPEAEGGAVPPNYLTNLRINKLVYTEAYESNPELLETDNKYAESIVSSFSPTTWLGKPFTKFAVTAKSGAYTLRLTIKGLSNNKIIVNNLPIGGTKLFTKDSTGLYLCSIPATEYSAWIGFVKAGTVVSQERQKAVTKTRLECSGVGTGFQCKDVEYTDYVTVGFNAWSRDVTGLSIQIPNPAPIPGKLPQNLRSHYYNLRNQTWAEKRLGKTGSAKKDPIAEFFAGSANNEFPANTDSIYRAFYPNVDESNKTANRFHGQDLWGNPSGNLPAPKGYFIIDALNRSDSREQQWQELARREGHIIDGKYEYITDSGTVELPPDTTKGGASAVAEYAGRLWYAGFSGDGSNNDTRLESFLLYSQLTNSRSGYWRCYQENDPTSFESPDLLATDGGTVPLDGAYGIQRLVQVGNSLIVFASNGIWSVSGNDGNLFSPTSQRVFKLTDKSSIATRSIVVVDNTAFFWTLDGIYKITVSEKGDEARLENITYNTIHSYYTAIPSSVQRQVAASYDPYDDYISWAWNNTTNRSGETEILRYKVSSGAFFKYEVKDGDTQRAVLAPINVVPFIAGRTVDRVVVDGEQVVVDMVDEVVVTEEGITDRPSTSKILVAHMLEGGNFGLFFADYSNTAFQDWGEEDANAYLVTSYMVGEDSQRRKQIPYITAHFERTEQDFELKEDVDGVVNIQWTNPSSCKMYAQWDWTNNSLAGKWGTPQDVYRLTRHFIPEDPDDDRGSGYSTTVTKNKLRGRGRAVALKWETESLADCRLLGYGVMWQGNSRI